MFFFTRIDFAESDHLMPESMMALGFTLIGAYLLAKILKKLRLPKITGYIIAGIITGPFFINLLSVPVVKNLQLIDNIALSLIALTAGGEFKYKKVKNQMSTIVSAIFWQIIVVMAGFVGFVILYSKNISFIANASYSVVLGTALLIGALSVAKSPATTIAIITETKAKGPFTDFILAVTVFKDIIIVLLFSITLSIAKPLILEATDIQLDYFFHIVFEILLSIALGVVIGAIILFYLKYVGQQRVLFLLGLILFGIELSSFLPIKIILLFMVAGFFVQNFSDLGSELIDVIEEGSLPIFVIFFTIAGASLNLPIFIKNWLLALVVVILRLITTFMGTYIGGKLTGSTTAIQRYGWMGFVGQAGLSLGLASLTKQTISGSVGLGISTIIVASITINQIIGPILLRYAFGKVGEIHATD
jgi:Kef-type K+ transport system membrane component KefB